jgi:hypothetical protein
MKKRIVLVFLSVMLFAGLLPGSATVSAISVSTAIDSWVEIDFPTLITFKVMAQSENKINDLRLHYRIERREHARITSEVYIPIIPSISLKEYWEWDMRQTGGLPPGSTIDYWWTVTDELGNTTETIPKILEINDERYSWQSVTKGDVTLYWYDGDEDFSNELVTATQEALARLNEESGATLENPVSIYIYANSSDLRGSMIFPQEWTGGVAFTRYGIIAIGIGNNPEDIAWGKRAIAHELTHLVIHQVTFNPYSGLPTWLDEGLAVNAEGPLQYYYANYLYQAYEDDSFISVRSLASPFSTDSNKSLLSYAQSFELVRYLIDEYGREKMSELLNTFRQGSGYDAALLKVYGFDMDGLETRWKATYVPVIVS